MNLSYNSDKVAGFVRAFLLDRYDAPVDIPPFHREMWDMALSGSNRVAFAAPRSHAKSTAVTLALTLFLFCFRMKRYGLIISDTESQASEFLGNIKTELLDNANLREVFGIKGLEKDSVTDIIVKFTDNSKFRIRALGAEQKVRGRLWNGIRPDYVVIDDLENDEVVESEDRRAKLKNWFLKALLPSVSISNPLLVMVGTILHMDSILMRLMGNSAWTRKLYKAHAGFDDFRDILWPEQWPEHKLRQRREEYTQDGYAEGYAQEYLNDPTSHSEAFFKKEDFREMEEEMYRYPTTNYAAIDFAISDADKAAFTVIVVGGMDSTGRLLVKHVSRFRGDSNEILDTIFQIQRSYQIDMWKMEQGQIKQTLMGEMYNRMNASGTYLNINPAIPTKDKRSRARAIQARMRAGGVYFDKRALWYSALEQEFLHFPKGMYKDQVDALSWLGIAINELHEGPTKAELDREDYENKMTEFQSEFVGQSSVTGY